MRTSRAVARRRAWIAGWRRLPPGARLRKIPNVQCAPETFGGMDVSGFCSLFTTFRYTPAPMKRRLPPQARPEAPVKRRDLTRTDVHEQLRSLGVLPGSVVLVHTSFRALRPIEGGPRGLIEALRGAVAPGGTLAMPSWTGSDDEPFDAASTPSAPDLGVVASTFWRQPGVMRSQHAFALAAYGQHAQQIVEGPLPLPPHGRGSPVGRIHELDGYVLLLGVGHDANTMLHFAEVVAGVPYGVPKHITVMRDGRLDRVHYHENDHCCARFALLDDWLRVGGLQREGRVGHAHARLVRARDVVDVALAHLERDPLVFLHPESEACEECDAARSTVQTVRTW
jgi:aminoglycoside N3'-acetyltransferase